MKNVVAWVDCNGYSYDQVKHAFNAGLKALGMNDFSEIVKPGMKVFIKPNWVASKWRESCPHKDDIYSVITHPAVIEETADRVAEALQGSGEIIIGDNPSIDADFEELLQLTGLKRLEEKYNVPCRIIDLRPLVCKDLKDYGQRGKMVSQPGDPLGGVVVNLAEDSMFYGLNNALFHGVFEQKEETYEAHHGSTHLYTFARSIFDSDLFISLPKMKTHHKAGVTLNIKGLVGTITQKNQLIHWRDGHPAIGGDEYPNQAAYEAAKSCKVKHRGSWDGNDTIWRMVIDLYHAFFVPARKTFTIIDGIVSGEGNGPFCPVAKQTNALLFSQDLLAADLTATRLMGLNYKRVPYLNYLTEGWIISEEIAVIRDNDELASFFEGDGRYYDFQTPENWRNLKI